MEHELKASLSQKLSWWAAYLTCKTLFIPQHPIKLRMLAPACTLAQEVGTEGSEVQGHL